MHVATLIKSNMFAVEIDGASASIADVFPDWTPLDRFGIVIDEPFGGVGATHLIQAAMVAFYDIKPARRTSHAIYPEIYAIHVGKSHGAHSAFDFWPARREIVLRTSDHREVLDAVNDRGITRLAVPERPRRSVVHRPKEAEAAIERIASAFLYAPGGRVSEGDVVIRGLNARSEYNPREVLEPPPKVPKRPRVINPARPIKEGESEYYDRLRELEREVTAEDRALAVMRREAIRSSEGTVRETFRRLGVPEALERMAGVHVRADGEGRRATITGTGTDPC